MLLLVKISYLKMFKVAGKMVLHSWSWFGIYNFKESLIEARILERKTGIRGK